MNKKTKAKARKLLRCCAEKIEAGRWYAGALRDQSFPSNTSAHCALGLISLCAFDKGGEYPHITIASGDATPDQVVVVEATLRLLFEELPTTVQGLARMHNGVQTNAALSIQEIEDAIIGWNDHVPNGRDRRNPAPILKAFDAAQAKAA